MIICLKTACNQTEPTQSALILSERLPFYIIPDCHLVCDYFVRRIADFYLLTLDVSGPVSIHCQRCLEIFSHAYVNHTELAICRNEETAEKLMEDYECIVAADFEVDLVSIVTDELHLYAPEKHAELIECTGKL